MTRHALAPAPALALCLLSAPALAQPACSAGEGVAEAYLDLPQMEQIEVVTQFAWDGEASLVDVCNLLSSTGSFGEYWVLYSGEIDATHGGICILLQGNAGTEMYSCATPAAVARAYEAAPGTEGFILHFDAWQAEPVANITE